MGNEWCDGNKPAGLAENGVEEARAKALAESISCPAMCWNLGSQLAGGFFNLSTRAGLNTT
ncbi:hypothetical protein [Candidatus Nitrotoga sp. AM1P]|uniref:hypothetical protein n=1 Tax=Candidatus Nitrotoga sp. AM1P TaxID=2559597 RepID=UPI0010B06830|nr:hypothetical protein [Candidatus Nitrotoga sp. AM1P]BBJ24327.1 hypothetical protein W01_22540 [Candidatus Nitrotoga sp. AM1P]